MAEKSENIEWLAAPCGLYCGACSIYQAVKRNDTEFLIAAAAGITEMMGIHAEANDLQCHGCLSDIRAIQCRECLLRDCALSKGLTHCAMCGDFPCQQIIDFRNDAFAHHSEVIENIRRQQNIGMKEWIEQQQERWRCPSCDNPSEWYAAQCHHCGKALEDHF